MKPLVYGLLLMLFACKADVKERSDELYSRHLQKHVKLTIFATPEPKDKSEFNLLLLNDGQDLEKMHVKMIMDSLYEKGLIKPLLIVGIHAGDRMKEYGVGGKPDYKGNGASADKYSEFVDNELYPFVKKQAGVRKFSSVIMAGWSLGGLSAFDISWLNEKIDKVGAFSGSFWWRDKDASDSTYSDQTNRIMMKKLLASRKKPHLKYWFYAGGSEEKGDRDKDGIIDVEDDTRDIVDLLISSKKIDPADAIILKIIKEGKHDHNSWRRVFPEFLLWAVGK